MAAPAPIQEIDSDHPQPRAIDRGLERLRAGELIAFPSDTGYAVAGAMRSKRAAQALAALKPRLRTAPPVLICSSLAELARYARVSQSAFRELRRLLPGPYTVVLNAGREVPKGLLSASERVAMRMPDASVPRVLIEGLGEPLLMRSAVTEEGERLLDGRAVKAEWGDRLALILDAGPAEAGPSTVISLVDDELALLREGIGASKLDFGEIA